MPSISLPLASFLYNLSSVVLVIGAVAVLLGTIGTVWTGSVKERYGDDRIAANEADTARAQESAAKADERAGHANAAAAEANRRAAQLDKEAAEARVEQERLKIKALELEVQIDKIGPRKLSSPQISEISIAAAEENYKPIITFHFATDPESSQFAQIIATEFEKSGFTVKAGMRMLGATTPGLTVYDEVGALQRILRRAGIDFVEGKKMDGTTYIMVGEKPVQ